MMLSGAVRDSNRYCEASGSGETSQLCRRDLQDKIEATTRENAEVYEKDGRFAFPHTILLV